MKKGLVNRNDIGYLLVIVILGSIVFLQKCGGGGDNVPPPKIDTVVNYIEVHDTVKGRTKFIQGKKDTLWADSLVYVPDTSYPKLLEQYKSLGDKHFSTNIFKSEFELGEYGKAVVTDTVKGNQLISSGLSYNLSIPEKTITIEKPAPPKRQLYVGFGGFGNKSNYVDGVYIGGVYKDKQDRLSGVSVGYSNGQINFGLSSYWKIKF